MRFLSIFMTYGLVAQSISVPSTEHGRFTNEHRLAKRENTRHGPFRLMDCNDTQRNTIDRGVAQAVAMLDKTDKRLTELRSRLPDLRYHGGPSLDNVSAELASTFQTYKTLIDGHVEQRFISQAPQPRYSTFPSFSSERMLAILLARTTAMKRRLENNRRSNDPTKDNIEFRCGTKWLTDRDNNGKTYSEVLPRDENGFPVDPVDNPDEYFFDNRTGNEQYKWKRVPQRPYDVPPENLNSQPTWVALAELSRPWNQALIFNPYALSLWDSSRHINSVSYDQIQAELNHAPLGIPDHIRKKLRIYYLIDGYLSAQLIGIASSIPTLSGTGALTRNCRQGRQKAMQFWECACKLAQYDPESAVNEEANFMFLTIALYLDKHDWSTGLMRDPKEAKGTVQQDLTSDVEGGVWNNEEPFDWYDEEVADHNQVMDMDSPVSEADNP